jgi:plasmid stabilization system protein ParE
MDRNLRYHPLFECDVREAACWYDRRSIGLGDAFADAVNDAVAKAASNPEHFAAAEEGLRNVRVKRFPYVVIFDFSGDDIMFLSVLHTARSMEKWRERSRDSGTD